MKNMVRKIHRWLGLLMALQIMAWMVSGLYFAVYPIETIRGEHLTRPQEALDATALSQLVPVWVAWENTQAELGATARLESVELFIRDGRLGYRMSANRGGQSLVRFIDGFSGQVAAPIDAEAAERLALDRLSVEGEVAGVDWVTETPVGSEIRGRDLPVWRVRFHRPEALSLYLQPWSGELLARRTTRWRIFDFLWMLHIMDFDDRDDFNTPLLQIAAAAGLLVTLCGVVFWAMTTRLFRRRRAVALRR